MANSPSPTSKTPHPSPSLSTSHSPAMYASANPKSPRVNNLNQNLSDVTRMVALPPGPKLALCFEVVDTGVRGVEGGEGDAGSDATVDDEEDLRGDRETS